MRIVDPGPAYQSTGNVAGAPYAAWNNSAGTGLIGPTGTVVPLQNVSFSNANGIFFGGTTNQGGVTLTASLAAVSTYVLQWPASTSSLLVNALGVSSNNAVFFPYQVEQYLKFDMVAMLQSYSYVSSSSAASLTQAVQFGLYSNNASTWSLISSGASSVAITNSGVSGTVSYATATSTSGYGYGTTTFTGTNAAESVFGTVGFRNPAMQFGGSLSLSPGYYALGLVSTASSSSANVGINQALIGNVIPMSNLYGMGQSVTASAMLGAGFGTLSTASLPVSMAFSDMTNSLAIIPTVTFLST